MKVTYLLLIALIAIVLAACNDSAKDGKTTSNQNQKEINTETAKENPADTVDSSLPIKTYSNTRFKEVTVEKTGEHRFTVKGKAQIFEANFGWVVEDGHKELQKGFEMTDAGAPEWGNFRFSLEVEKERANSTLTLILFENSPKDGSRQYELPIALE